MELIVISLASARERRRRFEEQMRGFPLAWRFFDARTAPPADLRYEERKARLARGRSLRPAELGCFASHYECLRDLAGASSPRYLMIVEDDVLLDPSFPFARLPALMSACGIEYIRLHATFARPSRVLGELWRYRQLVRYLGATYGTCAYVISSSGAQRFLASITEIVRPVDDELDRFWHNGLPLYAVYPAPAMEMFGPDPLPPVPAPPSMPAEERLQYFLNRVREKARRVAANLRLRESDRRIAAVLRAPGRQAL